MFEFKMSYKEPDFHKPGDAPFMFPPKDVLSKYDANLIEIEGGNGTGKTTLLNCLALAFGYAGQETDLDQKKPMLFRKLRKLEGNQTLAYFYRISTTGPSHVDLKVERKEGQKERCWLNSKQVDLDTLTGQFDVVFLTEDDPKKVVNLSLGKLSDYFKATENRLVSLNNAVGNSLMNIRDFHDFKKKENELLNDIKACKDRIQKAKTKLDALKDKLQEIERRDNTRKSIELLADENQITSSYENLRRQYEELKEKEAPELIRKLSKEKQNLSNINLEIRECDLQILQICNTLKHHSTVLNGEKLVKGDYAEFNRLKKNMQEMEEKVRRMQIVDEMIGLFQQHPADEIVPLIEKPVREALSELYGIKRTFGDDRVFGLTNALEKVLSQKRLHQDTFNKIQDKIATLSEKIENLENFENIEKKFSEAESRYLDLQKALKEDRIELTTRWARLSTVKGDSESIKNDIRKLDVQMQSESRFRSNCEQRLRIHRENLTAKPKYAEKEKELQALSEMITRLQEDMFQWARILQQTEVAKKDFASAKEKLGFGLADYQKFVKAVGEFLGNQFEPVAFNYKLHDIKFFDIENNTFITGEERAIPIDDLSRGQSKVATLRKIFKEMDPSRKKIILIDEIADLDPENLQFVKSTLKAKLSEGSVLLAVLVRPTHNASAKQVEIRGWG
jgi:hypothetical protein